MLAAWILLFGCLPGSGTPEGAALFPELAPLPAVLPLPLSLLLLLLHAAAVASARTAATAALVRFMCMCRFRPSPMTSAFREALAGGLHSGPRHVGKVVR